MEKLSGYIPLLIIIVVGIISAVRKTKQLEKGKSLTEEVFPSIPQLSPVYEEPISSKKIVTPATPKISIPDKRQHPEPVYEQQTEIQDIEENSNFNIDLSDPEEVKKAVIYSEIFNRRDF